MRLPGTPHACGPLLELGWLVRHLQLGTPVAEGVRTIAVADIVGSVQRGRDFDACWHPLNPRLAKLIDDIGAAQPTGLDEPIDVVSVDHAFFVRDGHKRVALARRTGREFIDAAVSRVPAPFHITAADMDEEAILRTARESEFRRHTGLVEACPDVRFVLSDVDAYGELYVALREHAIGMAEAAEGALPPWRDVATDWYRRVYLPTVKEARAAIGRLVETCTDADIFLAIHRQRVAWWGSECDAVDCAAQQLLFTRKMEEAQARSLLGAMRRRVRARSSRPPAVLPLSDENDHSDGPESSGSRSPTQSRSQKARG